MLCNDHKYHCPYCLKWPGQNHRFYCYYPVDTVEEWQCVGNDIPNNHQATRYHFLVEVAQENKIDMMYPDRKI